MDLIWFLLIGLTAGWLAGKIMKGHGFGIAGNLVVGTLGALVGGYLFKALDVSADGFLGSLVMAVVGAMVLLFILRIIR
jgi:uncharacterized membrane protein YeaQ/YmgE (transglycosylase-associated protein family)